MPRLVSRTRYWNGYHNAAGKAILERISPGDVVDPSHWRAKDLAVEIAAGRIVEEPDPEPGAPEEAPVSTPPPPPPPPSPIRPTTPTHRRYR